MSDDQQTEKRIEAGADAAVVVCRSGIRGHVILRIHVGDRELGVSLRADEAEQVRAAMAEMLPKSGPTRSASLEGA